MFGNQPTTIALVVECLYVFLNEAHTGTSRSMAVDKQHKKGVILLRSCILPQTEAVRPFVV